MHFKRLFEIIFLIALLNNLILSQSSKLYNIRFVPEGDNIIIYYDLEGDEDETYLINCYLKSESDNNFNYKIKYVDGDIGEDQSTGSDKKIVWYYTKEFPQKLVGEDFYFEVTADIQKASSSWLYYAGGAILGGTAAALLLIGKGGETSTVDTYANFPARPK